MKKYVLIQKDELSETLKSTKATMDKCDPQKSVISLLALYSWLMGVHDGIEVEVDSPRLAEITPKLDIIEC